MQVGRQSLLVLIVSHVTIASESTSVPINPVDANTSGVSVIRYYFNQTNQLLRGGSRVWKEGGHLAEKQLKTNKKKKVTTIITSYPLPNISHLLCKIKSYL